MTDRIAFVPYALVDPSGQSRVIPLLTPPSTEKPDYARTTDIDIIITKYLTDAGWDLSKLPNMATAARVAMFMTRQLNVPRILANVWIRVAEMPVDKDVAKTAFWKMTAAPGGGLTFAPGFWVHLFKVLECRLNPEMIQINEVLRAFQRKAIEYGVHSETRILPFAFLRSLVGRGLEDLLAYRKFQRYLFNGPINDATVRVIAMHFNSLEIKNDVAYEEAWVLLLAASFFRKMPLVPDAVRLNQVPFLESVLEESRRKTAEAERARREARDRENASKMVGQEKPEVEPPPPPVVETVVLPPPPPVALPPAPAPVPRPYPSAPTERPEDVTRVFYAIKEPVARGPKAEFLAAVGRNRAFTELFGAYCKATGFERLADPVWLLRSVGTCLVGGDRWTDVHRVVLKDFGPIADAEGARRALGALAQPDMLRLFNLTDNEGVGISGVPADVHKIFTLFSAELQPWMKREDAEHFDKNAVKMMMVLYSGDDYANLWRGAYKWSYDEQIADTLVRWKKVHPVLPTPIRAYALRLMFASV